MTFICRIVIWLIPCKCKILLSVYLGMVDSCKATNRVITCWPNSAFNWPTPHEQQYRDTWISFRFQIGLRRLMCDINIMFNWIDFVFIHTTKWITIDKHDLFGLDNEPNYFSCNCYWNRMTSMGISGLQLVWYARFESRHGKYRICLWMFLI